VKTGASIDELPHLHWAGGSAEPLGDLLARCCTGTTLTLEAGDCLWREGDHAACVVVLREGALEVVSAGPDCEDIIVLRRLVPGEVLGEISCLDGGRAQPWRCITLSGGVACYPEDASALDYLIRAPDANLYRAKERGRNRVSAASVAARSRPVAPP
jgi:CRP-like cAMP-binding protein